MGTSRGRLPRLNEGEAMSIVDLIGKSNDEIVQWMLKHGCFNEKALYRLFPEIEAYCAQHTIGLYSYVVQLVELSNAGIRAAEAGKQLRKVMLTLKENDHGEKNRKDLG